jgi:uncharacterized protein (TIGR04141 family)
VYRQNFPFVDYLQVVKDDLVIFELEKVLRNHFQQRSTDKLLLAYPEIPDFEQIEQFKIWQGSDDDYLEEVDLSQLYRFLDNNGLGIDLDNTHFIGLDHNDQAVTKKYDLRDFVVFETVFSGTRYLLSLNRWFELAERYVDEVNIELRSIQELNDGFLPPLRRGQREDEYNLDVANSRSDIALLDKRNYPIGGHSRIEVCDLLTQNSEFICVKKYNSSSTLSHLFDQGYVSSTLLNDDKDYREYILNVCQDKFGNLAFSENHLDKDHISFVFAIATNTPGPLAENLPFFSKVNLIRTNKTIKRMGFDVKLYKIKITK